MPWRGPSRGEPWPSLGYEVADWIEASCAIPDGEHMGEPFILTDEQLRFLVWHYRLHPTAKPDRAKPSAPFFYRRSQLVRPQKWGKGPLAAAQVCVEAEGPVLFDGWDANGDPVGRPWATPWIQCTAVSEDQVGNVWRALLPMIELGAIATEITDTGLTRINLPGGGFIEPVTASARSRLGQRLTFAVQDQTESWSKRNGGVALADNQRRNLAGMGGRSIETPNAWDPHEASVAQATHESPAKDIFKDYPTPAKGSFTNARDRRRILKRSYGDSWWVDLARIEADVKELLPRDPAQAERFFGNRVVSGADAAFDADRWNTLASPDWIVPKGARVVIGVDGARYDDALGIVATQVESGYQWMLGVWERPENAGDEYEHPLGEVDQAMIAAFEQLDVWRVYIDPQRIEHLVERWQGRFGEKVVVEWRTDRSPKMVAYALRSYRDAQTSGDLTHDGSEPFARHIRNARRRDINVNDDDGHPMWTISKDRPGSPLKIDLAMAGTLSWEARGDCIAAGALKPKRKPRGHTF